MQFFVMVISGMVTSIKTRRNPQKKYWRDKIETNMQRDIRITRKLRREGWSVLRFWEHDIEKRTDVCIDRIIRKILEK